METDYKKLQRFHCQEMKRMEHELAKAHSETVTVRKYWGEVMDDLDKEHRAEVSRLLAKIKQLEKENLELARQRVVVCGMILEFVVLKQISLTGLFLYVKKRL